MTKEEKAKKLQMEKLEKLIEQIEDLQKTIREGNKCGNDIVSLNGNNITIADFADLALKELKKGEKE
jgi:hypothetical protein